MGEAVKPTFIGNFRSGTTLLANLLGLNEAIVPWFETKWMCEALRYLRVVTEPGQRDVEATLTGAEGPDFFNPSAVAERMLKDIRVTAARIDGRAPHGKAEYERYILGHDYILYGVEDAESAVRDWREQVMSCTDPEVIATATGDMIRMLGDRQVWLSGKPYWINKTPEITRFGKELRQCLGATRIILMIRNGRDVVRSATHLGWAEVGSLAKWWRGMIEQSREASRGHEKDYLEVRYETLVDNPTGELNRIFRFLGVEESADQLVVEYQKRISICRLKPSVRVGEDTANPCGLERFEDLLDKKFLMSLGYD